MTRETHVQAATSPARHKEQINGDTNPHFDEERVLHELKHYLPSQTPLRDFIHHNSLHAFQHQQFYDAIFKASGIFGYQVTLQLTEYRELYKTGRIIDQVLDRVIVAGKGAAHRESWRERLLSTEYDMAITPRIGLLRSQWKSGYQTDLDNLVHPLLFRILGSYLDQGISTWKFPSDGCDFLSSLRDLEKNSFSSFFKTGRARKMFLSGDYQMRDLLRIVVGDEAYFEQYLFDQQFSHQGWSGIVSAVADFPSSLLDKRTITLHDLIILELLMEIDSLEAKLGNGWLPLCTKVTAKPLSLFDHHKLTEANEVLTLWQDAFEWSYYDQVLCGIASGRTKATPHTDKSFQAFFCIDERECSLRRHIEKSDPSCETLGTPGFFGVEFFFQPRNGKFYDKLCPAPVTPGYLVKEVGGGGERKHELLYNGKTHYFLGGLLSSFSLGFFAVLRLAQNIFRPRMSPAISNAFAHMNREAELTIENIDPGHRENNLQVGFTIGEMATRVEGLLRGVGLTRGFAPIVYMIAHGSSSANNPHHGAHDCGACSGRPGSVNSRVFSFMANHPAVREVLKEHGIVIPADTRFIGGMHDTAADQLEFYDVAGLNAINAAGHLKNTAAFENALDLNARERSRRFASIDTKKSLAAVRKEILKRSVSMFEPRPELGHGTNTLCIVGSRELTSGLFLDRRAFLNSYDHASDPGGKLLAGIMRPLGPVCGGINLEYYFSRVDNYKLGAGTKLPHNVMGLIGVANSSDGDLRPGLPVQMIEVHDPVRLLIIVEHFPDVVLQTVQSAPEMYEWYINNWIHLVAAHPETHEFFYFKEGAFIPYTPAALRVETIANMTSFIESAKEMETNYIVDATSENLPVHTIN